MRAAQLLILDGWFMQRGWIRQWQSIAVGCLFTIPVAVHATPVAATPTLTTTATYNRFTFTISDTAVLSRGNNPTGTVEFDLFDPSDNLIATTTDPVSGDGSYQGSFILGSSHTPGTYTLDDTYTSSDLNNNKNVVARPEPIQVTTQVGTPVPEPSTLALLGTGALGLLGPIRRKLLPLLARSEGSLQEGIP